MTEPFRTSKIAHSRSGARALPLPGAPLLPLLPLCLALLAGCIVPQQDAGTGHEVVTQPAPPLRTDPVEDVVAPAMEESSPAEPSAESEAAETPADEVAKAAMEAARASARASTRDGLRREAARILDDWHAAASVGDRNRYVGHFTPDAVFLGTDASERWDLATFTAYVDKHFVPGERGWAYTPSNRYVILGPDEKVAWFDEALANDNYGQLRGSGALRREGDSWKIAHYNMTFTIPNGVGRDVANMVREYLDE